MRLPRIIAILALVAAFTPLAPSHADILWDGACTLDLKFTFSSNVNLESGLVGVGMTSAGACESSGDESNIPGSLFHTVSTNGSGYGSIANTCEAFLADGGYTQSFSPSPPPGNGGSWSYRGTLDAGTMVLFGTSSTGGTVLEVITLAVDPTIGSNVGNTTACLTPGPTGTRTITLVGVIDFVDP